MSALTSVPLGRQLICDMAIDGPPRSSLNSRLFQSMPAGDAESILAAASRRTLRKGEVLIRQGEPAVRFFLIERGYLKLTQVTSDGNEVIVRFVGPRDPVAGVTALGEGLYPVTATACDRVDLLDWPRTVLIDLLARFPALKTNILREMTAHMDDALLRLRELATLKVSQRLAHTLLRLTAPSMSGVAGSAVPHTLTRQELAELTGTTLFTVSRILTDWESAGLVRSARAHVEVTDPQRLREAAEGQDD
jgi:CRP/FNR family transcriptional regulator, nitrogen oxide reductase regulator